MIEPRKLHKTKYYLVRLDNHNLINSKFGYSHLLAALTSEEAAKMKSMGIDVTALSGKHILEHENKPWIIEDWTT